MVLTLVMNFWLAQTDFWLSIVLLLWRALLSLLLNDDQRDYYLGLNL